MLIRAGELNRRITFQIKTVTYDSYNAPIDVWVDTSTVWSGVITTGGREFYAAQKLNAETSCLFKIRYAANISPLMRIKYGNRIFEILSINNVDGMNVELQISAKEAT